ncbi:MAG: hypothetical protein H6707_15380 [Deltaproteobacteria bacterium]|nr:hypothetical protein [Deltaproteobacteria bacterium]
MPGQDAVKTRTFVCERDGGQVFWEISWVGCEVEVATGDVNTEGVVEQSFFVSPTAAQAYVYAQIRAITAAGWIRRLRPMPPIDDEWPGSSVGAR